MFFVKTLDEHGKIVVLNLSKCTGIRIEAASNTSGEKYDIVFIIPGTEHHRRIPYETEDEAKEAFDHLLKTIQDNNLLWNDPKADPS